MIGPKWIFVVTYTIHYYKYVTPYFDIKIFHLYSALFNRMLWGEFMVNGLMYLKYRLICFFKAVVFERVFSVVFWNGSLMDWPLLLPKVSRPSESNQEAVLMMKWCPYSLIYQITKHPDPKTVNFVAKAKNVRRSWCPDRSSYTDMQCRKLCR